VASNSAVSVLRAERGGGPSDGGYDPAVLRLSDPVDRRGQGVGEQGAGLLGAVQARPGPAVPVGRPRARHASHCVQLQVRRRSP